MLSLIISACSTKKNTFTRRLYHNINAHYNAYWNGNESLKQGILDISKTSKDNYTSVLPIYNYGNKANAQAVNPAMDRAIEKASKVIQRHSMRFDNKELIKWVMKSYMLIGKANFYKQDYPAARRAFDFVIKEYAYDPIKYEAMLWLAKTYQELNQYDMTLATLDLISEEAKTKMLPWDVRKSLPLAYGDLFITQKKYGQAAEQIEESFALQSGPKFKTRLNYILGQLYQQLGKDNLAAEYYTLAIKGTPSFEMAFNARINLARVFDAARTDRDEIVKELEKMLKDSKNREFQDQIYFALAEIDIKEKNDTSAINNLRMSVASSIQNDFQKSISALRLADIYFNKQQYGFAQRYYDTTLLYLPEEFPDYDAISDRTEIVSRLVDNLQTIHVQDSLQTLAKLPEAQRMAIIDQTISVHLKREEQRLLREKEERMALDAGVVTGGARLTDQQGGTVVGGGGWYFYNPSAVGMGYSEFIRKWGRRRLEDNWRLSNKRVVAFDQMADQTGESDSITQGDASVLSSTDLANRQTYIAPLPLTPEKVEASNELISSSLYDAGIIYLEELFDVPRAESTFSTLLERFPEHKNALQAHYYMYRINKDAGDSTTMAYHSQQIINNYPESDYAKLLIDPDYKAELEAAQNRVKTLYEETWQAFQDQLYRMVIIYSNDAIQNYPGSELIPQFAYLRALAIGKTEGTETMNIELAQVANDYPASPVVPYINTILGKEVVVPQAPGASIADTTIAPPVTSIYTFDPANTHFYALIVDRASINISATKTRISDFNTKNYNSNNLQVNSVTLDGNQEMITVSSFNNGEEALAYFSHLASDTYVFSGMKEGTFNQFIISASNYPVFFQDKQVPVYLEFFKRNYPQQ